MNVARSICVTTALLLPLIVAAQSVATQPARERSGSAERDGSRTENTRQQRADADSPGKSEKSKGKKGEAPGQDKKANKK